MKTIIRGRDSGKAQELLQYAREENAMIITQNKRAFKVKANALGFDDITIVDYEDLANENFAIKNSKVIIHNADKWLEEIFFNTYGLDVIGFSATSTSENYNYLEEMKKDIRNYCQDNNISLEQEDLEDELWNEDSITGNQSGYDSEEKCQLYISQNIKLAQEAMESFDCHFENIPKDNPATYIDTTIRCYLLALAIEELRGEMNE